MPSTSLYRLSPFLGKGAGSPSNTKSLGARPSSIPSDILIHAAIWPQLIWAENWGLCPCVRWRPSPPPQKGAEHPSPKKFRLVYCGQTAGWIKMPLGTKVGIRTGDSVLNGDTAPLPTKGADATWYEGRPQPRGLWVRWGPTPTSQKGGGGRGQSPPNFRPMAIVAERLDGSRWHALGMEVGLGPVHTVLDGDSTPSPKQGAEPPPPKKKKFGPSLLWPNGCMHQDATWYGGRPGPTRHCVRYGPSYPQKKGTPIPPNFWPMSFVTKWLDG